MLTAAIATDVEGIFRLSGSAKRIKDLQVAFDSPDRYGKGLDWTGYTVHDAANILRRYLNQLPEPIVPLDFYDRFRKPLRSHQGQAAGNRDAVDLGNFNLDQTVQEFQRLIIELPALNRQLLLYILDLLAVFSSKSDLNRMTSSNLAAIFQPGIISHPDHDMAPSEYRLSQDVLIFLIENQDHFLVGMSGTQADEKTIKDIQTGPPVQTPSQTPKIAIGRSASNASGGADSLRKHGSRRNVSVSSRASRDTASNGAPSPLTPSSGAALGSNSPSMGVKRSNTVPTKRSPAITPSGRFQRNQSPMPGTDENSEEAIESTEADKDVQSEIVVPEAVPAASEMENGPIQPTSERISQPQPTKERKFPNIFSRSPQITPADSQSKDLRPSNKLKKKQRIPGSTNDSAQSSQASLTDDHHLYQTPLLSPELTTHAKPDSLTSTNPTVMKTSATPLANSPAQAQSGFMAGFEPQKPGELLKPSRSPDPSLHSRSSMTDPSDLDGAEDPGARAERKEKSNRNWRHRFSSSAKKGANGESSPLAPPPPIGQHAGAGRSGSSFGSSAGMPSRGYVGDNQATQMTGTDPNSTGYPSVVPLNSQESSEPLSGNESERRTGIFGKIRAKMDKSREDRKDREAEKERAKSPPRGSYGQPAAEHGSRQSLTAFAQEHLSTHRPRSMDKGRQETSQLTGSSMAPTATTSTEPKETAPQTNDLVSAVSTENKGPSQASATAPVETNLTSAGTDVLTTEAGQPT